MHDLSTFRQRFFDRLVSQDVAGGARVIEEALRASIPPEQILLKVVNSSMDEIGRMQENREITLSEIYTVARIGDQAINRLTELMPVTPEPIGVVVIGTAWGDYHGLGRKIVSSFLRAAGLIVHDLGMSVPSARFVDAAVERGASVICVSALLLHTAARIREVRAILRQRGLEHRIRLVAGGAALNFDRRLFRELGADATAPNGAEAALVVSHLAGRR